MTLRQRQLKAVRETKEKCIEEHLRGVGHMWVRDICPLCKLRCKNCPLSQFEDVNYGCIALAKYENEAPFDATTPQDIACFLYSLELYLKEDLC